MNEALFHASGYKNATLRAKWPGCPVAGVFVDVGAGDPVDLSNTYHFERNGWSGLLVEADPWRLDALRVGRTGSIVHALVDTTEGTGTIYPSRRPDRSSVDPSHPGSDVPTTIPAVRLETLRTRHGIGRMDLLSVDVEGAEADDLASFSWEVHRPRAVIVEYEHAPAGLVDSIIARGYVEIDRTASNAVLLAIEETRTWPMVSCLMATYGRYTRVCTALGMFLAQDYADRELIILNNHPEPLHFRHPLVRIINEPGHPTLGDCRNRLLDFATGELIRTWDDDDLYLPWCISQGVERLGQATAWKPARSWFTNGGETFSLAGNAMEASVTWRRVAVETVGYAPVMGNEHGPLLASIPIAQDEVGHWAGYGYTWGCGAYHASGTLGSDRALTDRTAEWQRNNQDVRPGVPLVAADPQLWWQKMAEFVPAQDRPAWRRACGLRT